MSRGRPYLHVLLLYRKLQLKVSEKARPRRDRSILEDSDDHGGILENAKSHRLNGSLLLFITLPCMVCFFMNKICFHLLILFTL
jgi:hypothetical protein